LPVCKEHAPHLVAYAGPLLEILLNVLEKTTCNFLNQHTPPFDKPLTAEAAKQVHEAIESTVKPHLIENLASPCCDECERTRRGVHATKSANGMAWFLILFATGAALSMGWRGSPEPYTTAAVDQPYDVSQERPFAGKILRIDPPPCVATDLDSYHVLVQLETETVEVHLGPCWFTKQQKPLLKAGDPITGVGVKASWRSGPRRVIIARVIRHGNNVLRFRDSSGKGLWRKGL
jgi:hypothetical protein